MCVPLPKLQCVHLRVVCKRFRCTGGERHRFGRFGKVTSDPSSYLRRAGELLGSKVMLSDVQDCAREAIGGYLTQESL